MVKRFTANLFLKAQIILGFLFFSYSCSNVSIENIVSGQTMGTKYNVKIIHSTGIENIDQIKYEIDSILFDFNKQMSTWIDESEISIFNKTLSTKLFKISDEFFHVLEQGKIINQLSDGAFDYTVFSLAANWGFGPEPSDILYNPEDDKIKQILSYTGSDKIELDYPFIKKTNPNVQLDLNAIAKGYAVDLVYAWLQKSGFNSLFIEIGGEIRCSGFNKEGKDWVIGIDSPLENSRKRIFTTVQLRNASLATSGNYRNYLERDGEKINHTINPVTGEPVATNVLSVSVKSQSCLSADAWATALMVMTLDEGIKKINSLEETEAFWILSDQNGNLDQRYTKNFFKK